MAQTIDVREYVDGRKFNSFNVMLLALSFVIMLVDGFDITVTAFAVPELIKAWNVNASLFGPVLGASLIGMLIGAPIFGFVGDRYGRKTAIVICYVVFGAFTLMAAWSASITQLAALRLLAGIGIGGLLPNIAALNAEFASRRFIATSVIVSFTGVAFGGAMPGPVAAFLVPQYGWQVLFYVGGAVPLLFALIIAFWLPESIRFLALKDRKAEMAVLVHRMDPGTVVPEGTQFVVTGENKSLPFKYLFSGELAIMTPLLWLVFALNLMVYFFLISWMPTLLSNANIPIAQAALATAVFQLGGVIGSWSIARPIDRYGMWPIAVLFFTGVPIIASIGYFGLRSSTHLMVIVFFAGFCALGVQMGINAVSAMLYPTALRSTGSGWAFGIGRVGSIVGPIFGGLLIATLTVQQLYLIAAIPFLLGAIICVFLGRMFAKRRVS